MPRKEDMIRVRHMREAANDARTIIKGKTRDDFDKELTLRLSLVRCIEIIGEAASRVSPETQGIFPTVPWRKIVNMRNRLIHAYFDINPDIVWKTAVEALPPLLVTLEEIIDKEGAGMEEILRDKP